MVSNKCRSRVGKQFTRAGECVSGVAGTVQRFSIRRCVASKHILWSIMLFA